MFWVVTRGNQLLKPVSALSGALANQHTPPMGSDLYASALIRINFGVGHLN
jgi:hypothetical protein